MPTVSATAGGSPAAAETVPAPRRIVVAIDELDRLPPAAAASYLDAADRLLSRPNIVTLAAVERSHVLTGFSETDPALAAVRLDRCAQLSYDLDADAAMPEPQGEPRGDDPAGLDLPWRDFENRLLQALGVFAGPNPRSIKRFVNSYRVARADPRLAGATPAELAALACALALDRKEAGAELGAYREASGATDAGNAQQAHIARALTAAQQAIGSTFTPADARRGLQVARIYSRRG